MNAPERAGNFYHSTIGSEKFERFSRSKLGSAVALAAGTLGIGAALAIIDNASAMQAQQIAFHAAEAPAGIGAAASIAVARFKRR